MAIVWRAVRPKYTSQVLSGLGAAQHPGRWNRPGEQMIYTTSSQALSMLELLPYLISPFAAMTMAEIEVPDDLLEILDADEAEAKDILSDGDKSREIGSGWLASAASVALAVPAVHIHPANWRREPNVLINPLHPDFGKVKVLETFEFSYDERLQK